MVCLSQNLNFEVNFRVYWHIKLIPMRYGTLKCRPSTTANHCVLIVSLLHFLLLYLWSCCYRPYAILNNIDKEYDCFFGCFKIYERILRKDRLQKYPDRLTGRWERKFCGGNWDILKCDKKVYGESDRCHWKPYLFTQIREQISGPEIS